MSRRVLLEDAAAPASRRFRRSAFLAASVGYVASVRALLTFATGVPDALALAAVLLAPLPIALGTLRLRRFLGFDPPPAGVLSALAAAGVLAFALRAPGAALPALLCALQGHLLVVLDDDRAAAWSPPIAVLQVLTGLSAAPSALAALLVPFAVATAVAAELLLLARVTRRAVARRALGAPTLPESDAGADRRLLYALPLALLLLVVALGALPLATTPPWRLLGGSRAAADGRRGPPPRNRAADEDADVRAMSFASDIVAGGIPMPAYEVLMEVVPRDHGEPLGDIGPLYLRGVVLSLFTATGVQMRGTHAPTRYRDADDGLADGFVSLRDPDPGEAVELEISHYPLPIEPHGWNLLFAVEPLYSVAWPEVRYDPDRLLVSTDVPDDWFTYSVVVRRPGAPLPGIGRAPAVHPDARYVQLPPESPGLRRVAAEGRRVTAGADTDLERVRRIVDHFRTEFEYSLEDTTFAGAEGLAEFLDRRTGFCAQFASAAVLMLRDQGLPARVVTGFLAAEWSDEQAAYQVRPRDTHAWFEVHFDRIGWVPFEATAPDARRRALGAPEPESGALRWAGDVLDGIGDMVTSADGGATPGDVLDLLRAAPDSVRRLLLVNAVVLIALLLALRTVPALLRGARRRARVETRELDDLYARLLRALAKRGHRKRAAQTPREFARAVAHSGGVAYRALRRITEDLYAARFGGHPLDADARARIDAFLEELREGRRAA